MQLAEHCKRRGKQQIYPKIVHANTHVRSFYRANWNLHYWNVDWRSAWFQPCLCTVVYSSVNVSKSADSPVCLSDYIAIQCILLTWWRRWKEQCSLRAIYSGVHFCAPNWKKYKRNGTQNIISGIVELKRNSHNVERELWILSQICPPLFHFKKIHILKNCSKHSIDNIRVIMCQLIVIQ